MELLLYGVSQNILLLSLILAFSITVSVCFVITRRNRKLQDSTVAMFDYMVLGLASLSIILVATEVRQFRSEQNFNNQTLEILFQRDNVMRSLKGMEIKSCRSAVKSDLVPLNFDEVEQQYKVACSWVNAAKKIIIASFVNNLGYIKLDGIDMDNLYLLELQSHQNRVTNDIALHNRLVFVALNLKADKNLKPYEVLLLSIMPLLVALTIALQFINVFNRNYKGGRHNSSNHT
ncbi:MULTISPECIES: hypothetical protein [Idiomarina]|uniref:hypothetical protein n=1 Tax=Idiomarina TaxID=135575 RepID=UPI00129D01E4|nr:MULTISPECIES: hypothetical protein [Idiomarina]MRJ43214.1 hypothetical protein [Idiomarina sp. FeN1]NCU58730.1 hypothetical protein [Idiomarina sp. FenA--70]NCU61426.1 hypothetical protein [Idiomarina sp. FenBw--71]UUN12691.1 hypothetical protein KGF88_08485 [Idiomarina loihiensis]